MLEELAKHVPITTPSTAGQRRPRVLVPGAGLGRLPLEIAARGYACQGSEFSYHMLLTSNFLLNSTAEAESVPLFPFIDQTCNLWRGEDNSREVLIPDVCPGALLGIPEAEAEAEAGDDGQEEQQPPPPLTPPPDFSMVAGDFQEVYAAQRECWDAVVTCFFLDTAPVVIEYVEAIQRLLRPGGVWVNLGPLLYHWAGGGEGSGADTRYGRSIELAWEEVRCVMVEGFSFEMVKEEVRPDVTYAANPGSMMRTVYDCVLFTARKPIKGEGQGEEGADKKAVA